MLSDRKKERFVDLAQKRTQRVINNLELIGNLSNKRNYIYTKDQYDQIFKAIKKALRESEEKFTEANQEKDPEPFKLSE